MYRTFAPEKLRGVIVSYGWTFTEVAAKLRISAPDVVCHRTTIYRDAAGKSMPTAARLAAYADLFRVPIDFFYERHGSGGAGV